MAHKQSASILKNLRHLRAKKKITFLAVSA